ncbi:MAG: hypothetical protein IKW76_13790 [Clostridia bacterium]|nr:hypothetical protein [Clostridia bacterium]
MKRIIALLIAAVLLFSAAGLPVFAANEGTVSPSVPQSVLSLEQVTGVFGNLLGRMLKRHRFHFLSLESIRCIAADMYRPAFNKKAASVIGLRLISVYFFSLFCL